MDYLNALFALILLVQTEETQVYESNIHVNKEINTEEIQN